ncbi:hypothetical protein UFOVP257_302 [uncultured Caudovirales phage]|uniref:Uncharacterized protein n=1 Tax=uncultured Caudovirales phage TaxID=2100421 RepID=A0A6J5LKR6_9CAUD|nr:hypothetical protein UFOVP257_302 [uncultured Caudovirales phage]
MSLVELLGYFVLGYLFYRLIYAWFWYNQLRGEIKEALTAEIEKIERKIKIVHYETVIQNGHSVVLMYDEYNNFIAQGESKEQVNEVALNRFPKLSLATIKEDETIQGNA